MLSIVPIVYSGLSLITLSASVDFWQDWINITNNIEIPTKKAILNVSNIFTTSDFIVHLLKKCEQTKCLYS